MMKEEKPLNIILDNARIHTAKIVEEACEILSIKFVFLVQNVYFLRNYSNKKTTILFCLIKSVTQMNECMFFSTIRFLEKG